jgi:hypothetical protein
MCARRDSLLGVADQGGGCPVDGQPWPEFVNISAGPLGGTYSHAARYLEIMSGRMFGPNDTTGPPTGDAVCLRACVCVCVPVSVAVCICVLCVRPRLCSYALQRVCAPSLASLPPSHRSSSSSAIPAPSSSPPALPPPGARSCLPKVVVNWSNVLKFTPNPSVDNFHASQCVIGGSWVLRGDAFFVSDLLDEYVPKVLHSVC